MRRLHLILAALVVTGCEGVITADRVGAGGTGGGTGSSARNCSTARGTPGHYTLRRLTNQEYTNTVQDLLFTRQAPGAAFQDSLAGGSGFKNDSKALSIYSTLVAKYYDTATVLAKEVITSKGTSGGAYSKLVTCDTAQSACAQQTVSALAKRALRRAVTASDLDATNGLMGVFTASGTFDQGLYDVIVSLLMHPEFLMIPVVDARSLDPAATFALDDYEVASRLSYFLWQSMPDAALLTAADQGTLHTPEVMRTQVLRMAADPRAVSLKNVLRDEFAELSFLAKTDLTQLGQTNALRDAMIGETDAFLADLLTNDRSPQLLLSSTQSFVNKTLADFYGLTFPTGANPNSFVPVTSTRVGLGSHAAVLTNTAGGSATFTNPIKRGHWIAKKLLCDEPPPPPPNIPPLPAVSQANATIRQRLDAHLNQPSCTGCHVTMDTLGLGAENFDSFGRWRVKYADQAPVDSTGLLPDGTAFADSTAMFTALANQTRAKSCVAQQVMKLALSRDLVGVDDLCTADAVSLVSVTDRSRFSDLLVQVVTTNQFLQQTGEAP
jgi:Protein of unknown function (DUF1592)/Protein of unknown function (DUF1588)/Protein of unknown function (DUF1587)/Protein of unknown function (DUF1595)/Protein of unknown function (DUF1585)